MKFLFIIFLFPLQLFAQDITGAWTGSLYNDTTKQYIHYELAVSEYNGKLSGYSHTTFIIDSVENIGVKSVKIKKKDESFLVEDEKLIYNNYPEPPAKGVKTFVTLLFSENDSAEVLTGNWHTNRTREFSQLTGTIFLERRKKIKETLIVPKLQEMGLSTKLSFAPDLQNEQSGNSLAIKNQGVSSKLNVNPTTSSTMPDAGETSMNTPVDKTKSRAPEKTNNQSPQNKTADTNSSNVSIATISGNKKPEEPVAKTSAAKEEKSSAKKKVSDKESTAQVSGQQTIIKKEEPKIAAAEISSREIETIRTVEISQDSLVLTLYDNGTVDGDTVSVLINGKVVWPRVGLLATATNKTIHLEPDSGDSLFVVMYAENLGSIAPNTGLLVVRDGDKNYEIRFSGDLKKNSAIILKRKKKQ